MMMKDAHLHLSFLSNDQLQNYWLTSVKQKVDAWALGGYDQKDWLKQIEIKKQNSKVKTCFGLHPWVIEEHSVEELELQWNFLLKIANQADAIGETGLDRFRTDDESILQRQTDFFHRSMQLACSLKKPVVLHVVQAHEQALKIIDTYPSSFGVAHSFSGSYETATEYIRRHYVISIGPGILKKGFKHLKEAVKKLDLAKLLIESDAPHDMKNPEANPEILLQVAKKVSELKSCAIEDVLQATSENFDKVFGR